MAKRKDGVFKAPPKPSMFTALQRGRKRAWWEDRNDTSKSNKLIKIKGERL